MSDPFPWEAAFLLVDLAQSNVMTVVEDWRPGVATLEERAVAQSDGRELLGIAEYVDEQGNLKGSQYVDLSQQEMPPQPEDMATPASEDAVLPEASSPLPVASQPVQAHVPPAMFQPDPGSAGAIDVGSSLGDAAMTPNASEETSAVMHPSEPFPASVPSTAKESPNVVDYGPIRRRHSTKKPEVVYRPPETMQSDLPEAIDELRNEKRASSRTPSCEPPAKSSRTEAMPAVVKTVETVEVFLANFLKKKMQTELHHSNNPPEIQEAIDESKVTEWLTLLDETGHQGSQSS